MSPWRQSMTGRAARALLATALTLGTTTTLIQAPVATSQEAPPPAAGTDDLSALIRAVADASARLDAAYQDIAVKREEVNKTLVDLQLARVDLDRAIADRDRTVREREEADGRLSEATATLQDYSRMLYRQGTAPGAAADIINPGAPADVGRRQELLQRAAADQRSVVGDLERARSEAGDRERRAGDALAAAEQRHAVAVERRDGAQTQVAEVSGQVAELKKEVETLNGDLDRAKEALAARGGPTAAPAPEDGAEVLAEDYQDVAKVEALRRLAGRPDAARLAQAVAEALPDHVDLGQIRGLAAGSSDVAKGKPGQIDSGSVENAVDAAVDGDQDAIIQQIVDAVTRADMGSVEQGPKPATTPTTAPGGGTAPSGDEASPTSTMPSSGSPSTSTTPQKDPGVPQSSSKKVEIVVDRALSQLGVPYAWGGGDANGPTLGIRDGGVADSFGDYAKIGFDCSGLMIYAFAGIGKALPHYTGYQYTSGKQVPVSQRKRGDMLFWPGHVALYLGDGKMVEAPQSGDVVKISPVRTSGLMPYAVRLTD